MPPKDKHHKHEEKEEKRDDHHHHGKHDHKKAKGKKPHSDDHTMEQTDSSREWDWQENRWKTEVQTSASNEQTSLWHDHGNDEVIRESALESFLALADMRDKMSDTLRVEDIRILYGAMVDRKKNSDREEIRELGESMTAAEEMSNQDIWIWHLERRMDVLKGIKQPSSKRKAWLDRRVEFFTAEKRGVTVTQEQAENAAVAERIVHLGRLLKKIDDGHHLKGVYEGIYSTYYAPDSVKVIKRALNIMEEDYNRIMGAMDLDGNISSGSDTTFEHTKELTNALDTMIYHNRRMANTLHSSDMDIYVDQWQNIRLAASKAMAANISSRREVLTDQYTEKGCDLDYLCVVLRGLELKARKLHLIVSNPNADPLDVLYAAKAVTDDTGDLSVFQIAYPELLKNTSKRLAEVTDPDFIATLLHKRSEYLLDTMSKLAVSAGTENTIGLSNEQLAGLIQHFAKNDWVLKNMVEERAQYIHGLNPDTAEETIASQLRIRAVASILESNIHELANFKHKTFMGEFAGRFRKALDAEVFQASLEADNLKAFRGCWASKGGGNIYDFMDKNWEWSEELKVSTMEDFAPEFMHEWSQATWWNTCRQVKVFGSANGVGYNFTPNGNSGSFTEYGFDMLL